MDEIKKEAIAFLGKWVVWVISIAVGLIAKLSYELSQKRKLGVWQVFGITGISIFFGYLASILCVNNGWVTQGQIIVPVATLLGEKLAAYSVTNFNKIIDTVLGFWDFLKKTK